MSAFSVGLICLFVGAFLGVAAMCLVSVQENNDDDV